MTVKHFKPRLIDIVFFAQWAAVLFFSVYLCVSYVQSKNDSRTNLSLILKNSDNIDAVTNLDVKNTDAVPNSNAQGADNNLYMYYGIGVKVGRGPFATGNYPLLTAAK